MNNQTKIISNKFLYEKGMRENNITVSRIPGQSCESDWKISVVFSGDFPSLKVELGTYFKTITFLFQNEWKCRQFASRIQPLRLRNQWKWNATDQRKVAMIRATEVPMRQCQNIFIAWLKRYFGTGFVFFAIRVPI